MTNKQIEEKALNTVINHERARHREAGRVHNCGYDLRSAGPGGERHIEVKGTTKTCFTFRWLEPAEEACCQNDPNFWLYLVTEVESEEPKVWEYDRARLAHRFDRMVPHYHYRFPKTDFQ